MNNSTTILSNSSVDLSFMVEGFLIPLVAIFGTLGNLTSISVLRDKKLDMKDTFREILIMLTMFDTIFVLSVTITFSFPIFSQYWKVLVTPFLLPWLSPLMQISLNGSIWSTVSVALERFVSVVHPRLWVSSFSSIVYIIPTILLSIVWNIPRFNELYTCVKRGNESFKASEVVINTTTEEYSICLTDLRKDPRYIKNYILLANFFFMAFLPFMILIITNSLIYKTITNISQVNRKSTSRQKRDQSIAMILVGIVIVFGVCNTFRIIVNLYEVFHLAVHGSVPTATEWPAWCSVLINISHLFLVLNSSVNVIIYGWKDNKFREILLQTFHLNWMLKQKITQMTSTNSKTEAQTRTIEETEEALL